MRLPPAYNASRLPHTLMVGPQPECWIRDDAALFPQSRSSGRPCTRRPRCRWRPPPTMLGSRRSPPKSPQAEAHHLRAPCVSTVPNPPVDLSPINYYQPWCNAQPCPLFDQNMNIWRVFCSTQGGEGCESRADRPSQCVEHEREWSG